METDNLEHSDSENFGKEEEECFETDLCFSLINQVQKHRCIYDLEHAGHKDSKHRVPAAWREIAEGLKVKDDAWCKKKWKSMKEYYFKVKKRRKGKSGQSRKKQADWIYFKAMSFLDGVKQQNENTVSNLDPLDNVEETKAISSDSSPSSPEEGQLDSIRVDLGGETPPHMKDSKLPIKKRKLDAVDEINNKLLDYLNNMDKKDDDVSDRFHHWSKMTADRLRKLPIQAATAAMMKFDQILYDAEFPAYSSSFSYINVNEQYDMGN